MLCDRHRDATSISLLEGIRTEQAATNLTGDGDNRNRIEVGICQRRHDIRSTGSGGSDAYTDLSTSRGIAFRCVPRPLLVTNQHVVDLLRAVEGVIQR